PAGWPDRPLLEPPNASPHLLLLGIYRNRHSPSTDRAPSRARLRAGGYDEIMAILASTQSSLRAPFQEGFRIPAPARAIGVQKPSRKRPIVQPLWALSADSAIS